MKDDDYYTKGLLDEHFKNVNEKLDKNNIITEAIDNKVGIQNGRVSRLEGRASWLTGVGVCAIFLFGIIGSLIVYSFKLSQDNLKQSIFLQIKAETMPNNPEAVKQKIEELKLETQLLQNQIKQVTQVTQVTP